MIQDLQSIIFHENDQAITKKENYLNLYRNQYQIQPNDLVDEDILEIFIQKLEFNQEIQKKIFQKQQAKNLKNNDFEQKRSHREKTNFFESLYNHYCQLQNQLKNISQVLNHFQESQQGLQKEFQINSIYAIKDQNEIQKKFIQSQQALFHKYDALNYSNNFFKFGIEKLFNGGNQQFQKQFQIFLKLKQQFTINTYKELNLYPQKINCFNCKDENTMFINFNIEKNNVSLMPLWAIPIIYQSNIIKIDLQYFYYYFQTSLNNNFMMNFGIQTLEQLKEEYFQIPIDTQKNDMEVENINIDVFFSIFESQIDQNLVFKIYQKTEESIELIHYSCKQNDRFRYQWKDIFECIQCLEAYGILYIQHIKDKFLK